MTTRITGHSYPLVRRRGGWGEDALVLGRGELFTKALSLSGGATIASNPAFFLSRTLTSSLWTSVEATYRDKAEPSPHSSSDVGGRKYSIKIRDVDAAISPIIYRGINGIVLEIRPPPVRPAPSEKGHNNLLEGMSIVVVKYQIQRKPPERSQLYIWNRTPTDLIPAPS